MITRKYRMVIGRNEPVILASHDQELQVPAKVDTGAFSSAIHCEDINIVKKNGVRTLKGTLLKGHPCAMGKEFPFETTSFEKVEVFNSFGHRELRYKVSIRFKIGPLVFQTRITLADRSKKLFPILLGRQALKNRFLVDVSHSNVDRIELKKRYGKDIPDNDEDFIVE